MNRYTPVSHRKGISAPEVLYLCESARLGSDRWLPNWRQLASESENQDTKMSRWDRLPGISELMPSLGAPYKMVRG